MSKHRFYRVLCCVLLLIACRPAETERQTLTMWLEDAPQSVGFMQKMAKSFELEHPLWQVRMVTSPFNDLKPRLLGATVDQPDLVLMANDWLGELAERQWLQPVNLNAHDYLSGAFQGTSFKGKTYAYPFAVEVAALVHNTRLVPRPPKTWSEWLKISQQLQSQHKYPFMYENRNFYYHSAWLLGFGGVLFDAQGRLDFQLPAIKQSFEFAHALVHRWHMVPPQSSYAVMLNLFNSGEVGTLWVGPWALADIQSPHLTFATSPLPLLPNGKPPRPLMGVKVLGIRRSSQQIKGAEQLAQYLVSKPVQQKAIRILNVLSARHDLAHPQQYPVILRGFLQQISTSTPMPVWPAMAHVWQEGNWVLNQLFDQKQVSPQLPNQLKLKIEARLKTP